MTRGRTRGGSSPRDAPRPAPPSDRRLRRSGGDVIAEDLGAVVALPATSGCPSRPRGAVRRSVALTGGVRPDSSAALSARPGDGDESAAAPGAGINRVRQFSMSSRELACPSEDSAASVRVVGSAGVMTSGSSGRGHGRFRAGQPIGSTATRVRRAGRRAPPMRDRRRRGPPGNRRRAMLKGRESSFLSVTFPSLGVSTRGSSRCPSWNGMPHHRERAPITM